MRSNEEYSRILAREFPRFSLDLGMCSPRSMNLKETEFVLLLNKLNTALAAYTYLTDIPLLILRMQAVSRENPDFVGEHLVTAISVFTPFSTNIMASYEALIFPTEIVLKETFIRPINGIRKASLFGNSSTEDTLEANAALVWIVDDQSLSIKTLSTMIARLNGALNIRSFNDGTEVVQAYSNVKSPYFTEPKVIFMDIQMTTMDGLEASAQIRKKEKDWKLKKAQIIAVTATEIDKPTLETASIDAIIQKPFSLIDIQKALDGLGLLLQKQEDEPIGIQNTNNIIQTDRANKFPDLPSSSVASSNKRFRLARVNKLIEPPYSADDPYRSMII